MNKNIFGEPLKICGQNPLTGYDRTGFCTLSEQDRAMSYYLYMFLII